MYRTVDAAFWSDPKIKQLEPHAKLLALYLVTNPHSHVGGIYYLPSAVITTETGLSKRILDTLWDTLSSAGFARRDTKTDVIWVRRMLFYQGRGEKNARSVGKHLETLHKSFLINEFLKEYPKIKRFIPDRVSIGYSNFGKSGTQEQEQDITHTQRARRCISEIKIPESLDTPALRKALEKWADWNFTNLGQFLSGMQLETMLNQKFSWGAAKLIRSIDFSISKGAKSWLDPDIDFEKRTTAANGKHPPRPSKSLPDAADVASKLYPSEPKE